MKVALILPGSIWYAPYVRIYTRILDEQGVEYSIISWNREGDDKPEGFQYNVPCAQGHGSAGWKAYKGYIKYIKRIVKDQRFERIIVFGPQMTCLLSIFLLTHFCGRYMIDYRDLSIEQKPVLKQLFSLMLRNSRVNVISSPGYKKYLPKGEYIISHNFDINVVREILKQGENNHIIPASHGIKVLTIGAIRDLSSNMEVVKALANKDGISLKFVGKGDAATQIKEYCNSNDVNNVFFHGFYKKEEEPVFIQDADMMNIFYPYVKTHNTALSNRFYNSLIYKKPMIVNKDTTQGDYAEKYQVGLVVRNCVNLADAIFDYFKSFNSKYYSTCCDKLLSSFLDDYKLFEGRIKDFAR